MNGQYIQNIAHLLNNGFGDMRQDTLEIINSGISNAIPYRATLDLIQVNQDEIVAGKHRYPKGSWNKIYVVGVGKGSFPIAQALEERFGERIEKGIVVVKAGETRKLEHIEVFQSSHPIPDERSIIAAQKMMEILQQAGEDDLVFAPITGGSSAMVNAPADDIDISELRTVNELLLKCGAEIGKINTVRKHLCMLKGGRLVQHAQPAKVITLTLNTAPPDMPWPDMCLPDPTTYQDAFKVLQDYELWDKVPLSVQRRLERGLACPELETLKSLEGMKHTLYSVADPVSACIAAANKARELGYSPHILSTALEGEAKDAGIFLAGITNEILQHARPFRSPCALITGGETTVTINGSCGEGGPNQETVLGFAAKLYKRGEVVFASVDTDGTDGPCDIAGGIVDTKTMERAEALNLNLNNALQQHNSSHALRLLGDEIITGHTGTNVMNLRVVLIK